MWDNFTLLEHYADRNRGGVAPPRHELARRLYIEKARARCETERRAATTRALTSAASRLWALAGTAFAVIGSKRDSVRRPAAGPPAE